MKSSKFLSIGVKDGIKGLIMAVIAVILTTVYSSIEAGAFPTTWAEWAMILKVAASTAIVYILKNFLTNSKDQILKKE